MCLLAAKYQFIMHLEMDSVKGTRNYLVRRSTCLGIPCIVRYAVGMGVAYRALAHATPKIPRTVPKIPIYNKETLNLWRFSIKPERKDKC